MQDEHRNSGIELIKSIPWGTHFCHLYSHKDHHHDIVISYLKAGLEANEYCCWATSSETDRQEALSAMKKALPELTDYLSSGQLDIITSDAIYLKDGELNFSSSPERWEKLLSQALALGYDGARITGDAAWLQEENWPEFIQYEEVIHQLLANKPVLTMCSYPLDCCSADNLIDVVNHHHFALVWHHDGWQLMGEEENQRLHDRIQELNSLLLAIRNINKSIVREKSPDKLLQLVCRSLAQVRKYSFVLLIITDEDGQFKKAVETGLGTSFAELREQLEQNSFPDCIKRALSTRKVVTTTERKGNYNRCVLTKRFQNHVSFTTRMEHAGRIYGTLTVSTGQGNADEEERDLLKEAADDIAMALHEAELEEKLRASEDMYRMLVENAQDIVYSMTMEGVFTYVSPVWTRLLGHDTEEIVHHSFTEFVHPDDINTCIESLRRHTETVELPASVEYRIQHKNGTWRWNRTTISRTDAIGGKTASFIGVARDITEQRRIEQELQESQEIITRAFQASPGSITIGRLSDGVFVEVNEAFSQLTGFSREEVIGKNADDLHMWIDESQKTRLVRLIQRRERLRNAECEFRAKDGSLHSWLISTEYLTIGGELCVIQAGIDITEQKNTVQALVNDAARRTILMEESRDGIVVMSEDGAVQESNQKFSEMLGYTPEETWNLHVWDWDYQYTPDELKEMLRNVDQKGDHVETKHRRKDGSVIDVDINTNAAFFNGYKLIFCICRDVTEKKQAENALRESQELFATAFQSSPVMMALIDVQTGTYSKVNTLFAETLGYAPEELIGRTDADINLWVTETDRDRMIEFLASRKMRQQVFEFRTKTGDIRTWLCSADIIVINNRDSLLTVASDITEHQQAEKAIRESEIKFSKAFHLSPEIMAITRKNTYIDVNEAFCEQTGYTRDEVIGHKVAEFDIWESQEDFDEMVSEYQKNGRVSRIECRFRTKSGEIRTMLFSMETITIEGESCRLSVSTDITELKNAEEALRISGAAFKSIHDAVIIMDNDFLIKEWNHISEEIFGLKAEEVKGKFIGDQMAMLEEYPGQNTERMALLMEQGWNREEQRYHTTRGDIWVDVHAQVIEGEEGERHGWVTLAVDITERKKTEEEVKASYEREKALRESLEQETKKRLDFTRVLVHELKTPLTPIMATSEILADEMKEEPWSSMARNILRGGENLSKRIDELLDLAKGEIGTLRVDPVLFDPADYLREIATDMIPAAGTRNQNLKIEIPESLPAVKADAQRIRQVLTNLVNNAFKFSNDGGIITITARQEKQNLIVEVHDTGSGLTKEEQDKLFHPYERLEADRQKLSGLGLGLALSKNLIELHGGRIWVKSQKGKGSVFGFSLPINGPPEKGKAIMS